MSSSIDVQSGGSVSTISWKSSAKAMGPRGYCGPMADESNSEKPRSAAARVLGVGARGAERLAEATGVDQALEEAAEEAIVRALRSPAVERAIARVIVEHNAVETAV